MCQSDTKLQEACAIDRSLESNCESVSGSSARRSLTSLAREPTPNFLVKLKLGLIGYCAFLDGPNDLSSESH